AIYQAVYKTVNELLRDDVLKKSEDGYLLNLLWLKQIHDYTEITQTNYYTKSRVNIIDGVKDSKIEGNLQVLTFESWFDVEKYLYYLQKNEIMNSDKKTVLCVHHNHEWRPVFYMRAEYNWMKKLADKGHKAYFLCANSTPADSWAASFYRKMGVKMKTNVKCAETCEIVVIGDKVVQIYVPTELQKNLDLAFKKAKSVSEVDVPWLISNVFEKKTDIKVVINKDAKIAEQIISQTVSKFSTGS
ncbi:hypothetical protein KY308_02435, partial [Candidatus Woesearchaeota archaeon]|nr:hypothetical protein [Candidatus Woesearchaeota archaeon]